MNFSDMLTYLHSIMYLLILFLCHPGRHRGIYLHSIMYLLIRVDIKTIVRYETFTFHNVSINSPQGLLFVTSVVLFTFHNVSINSNGNLGAYQSESLFTFHNVSINSKSNFPPLPVETLFTFHNVSINSNTMTKDMRLYQIYIP